MKKKFIAYGSNQFISSSKRIIEDAKSFRIFDETQLYSVTDLPQVIKASPLFLDDKKGGYWLWKAYIIYDSLKKLKNGDILVYVDSGCELIDNKTEWNTHFEILNESDAIFFQYRNDKNYGWNAFDTNFNNSPQLKYWVKKKTIEHFFPLFEKKEDWLEKNKLLAGFITLKKTESTMQLIKDWLDVMIFYPELVMDTMIDERNQQLPSFSAHRHDQSILTIIVRLYASKMNLKILDESCEGHYPNQLVKASRRVDQFEKNTLKSLLKRIYNKILK